MSADFTKEHVIPAQFGKFGTETLTLINQVCRSCNQYFGDTIERALARDSIFGILYRVLSGTLDQDHFKKTIKFRRNRLETMIHDQDHQNVLQDLELMSDGRFSCEIANQIHVMNSTKGNRLLFRADATFPHRSKLEVIGLKPTNDCMKFLLKKDTSSSVLECNNVLRRSDIKVTLHPSEFGAFSFNNIGQPEVVRFSVEIFLNGFFMITLPFQNFQLGQRILNQYF